MRSPFARLRPSSLLLTALAVAAVGERPALAADPQANPPEAARAEPPPGPSGVIIVGSTSRPKPLVNAPYLGLCTEPLPLARCAELGLPAGTGLSVVVTEPGMPAAKAGLLPRDVLVKLDDQILINPAQLRVLVRLHKPGEPLAFEVLRDGHPMQVKAEPALRAVPELTPGGEESRVTYTNPTPGKTAGTAHILRIAPGEQPIPPEVLRDMPPELREQIEAMNKAGQAQVQSGSVTASATLSSRIVAQDGRCTLEVEHGKREHLRVTERQGGKVLYDGPIPTDAKGWEQIPADVRAKAQSLSQPRIIQFKGSPAGKPAPDAAPGK